MGEKRRKADRHRWTKAGLMWVGVPAVVLTSWLAWQASGIPYPIFSGELDAHIQVAGDRLDAMDVRIEQLLTAVEALNRLQAQAQWQALNERRERETLAGRRLTTEEQVQFCELTRMLGLQVVGAGCAPGRTFSSP